MAKYTDGAGAARSTRGARLYRPILVRFGALADRRRERDCDVAWRAPRSR
jgi:hypothetical protein